MLETRQQTLLLPESAADVVVRGDATLLRMLLRNLVENAHRYSPEGTHITIHISADPDAIMAVEDEGPGIDESKCGKLSEAFVRMDSRYGGIGRAEYRQPHHPATSGTVFPAKPYGKNRHPCPGAVEKGITGV